MSIIFNLYMYIIYVHLSISGMLKADGASIPRRMCHHVKLYPHRKHSVRGSPSVWSYVLLKSWLILSALIQKSYNDFISI